MHETEEDLEALQQLLDRSYAAGGEHLHRIITPERRLGAVDLSKRLEGMRLLTVATVTADGRPLAGPVDGIFYRGAFHFGSAPDSVRFRHLHRRPQVTATHLPGEELSVTVHGRAVFVDVKNPQHLGFRRTLLEIYTPRYGEEWEQFLDSGPEHVRIDADRMFTFHMES
jgi:nitroimidazol reductase NimA-like FMN-containing flavoprotein (pyridoxamine 5'-phosphate oxidase superfamily)